MQKFVLWASLNPLTYPHTTLYGCDTTPKRWLSSVKTKRKPRKIPQTLTDEEVRRILAQPNRRYPTGLRNYTIMLTMYMAGLRSMEILNLRQCDIIKSRCALEIRESKGGAERTVPIEAVLMDALNLWLATRAKLPQSPDEKYVFVTLEGEQMCDRYLRDMVTREAKAAKLEKHVHPHIFRHTYATGLLDEGFNIREVQALLGHANLSTTMIYTHVSNPAMSAKVQARRRDALP